MVGGRVAVKLEGEIEAQCRCDRACTRAGAGVAHEQPRAGRAATDGRFC